MSQYPNLNFWQTIYCWRSIVWQLGEGKGPGSPDFALIAFRDRANTYFTDVIWNNVPVCRCPNCVPLESTLLEDRVTWEPTEEEKADIRERVFGMLTGQEQEVPPGFSFVDQNGVRVLQGQIYTVAEYEQMAREQEVDWEHDDYYSRTEQEADPESVIRETVQLLIQVDIEQAIRQANVDLK